MSPPDPLDPARSQSVEFERLLDLDQAEVPRPGFDTRFFARLEEQKLSMVGGFWQSFKWYLCGSAVALSALGAAAFYWKAPDEGRVSARVEVAMPAQPAPTPPPSALAAPAAPTAEASAAEPEAPAVDLELALDLEIAEELEVVERLDEVEGVELLAQLDQIELDDREFERLLLEVATP